MAPYRVFPLSPMASRSRSARPHFSPATTTCDSESSGPARTSSSWWWVSLGRVPCKGLPELLDHRVPPPMDLPVRLGRRDHAALRGLLARSDRPVHRGLGVGEVPRGRRGCRVRPERLVLKVFRGLEDRRDHRGHRQRALPSAKALFPGIPVATCARASPWLASSLGPASSVPKPEPAGLMLGPAVCADRE